MSRQLINRSALLSLVIVAVTLACNQPPNNNPTSLSGSPVNLLEIVGPSSIPPGRTAQFTVNMRLADGTVKTGSTTTSVQWRSTNTNVLQVNQAGVVTALAAIGEANITAVSLNRSTTKNIVVQPDGTYRLVGIVTESGAPSVPIGNARVEVVTGEASTTTDAFGNYKLYGVPAVADIRITANSYGTEVFPVQLSDNTTRNFALNLTGPRPNFSGDYTLLLDIAGSCSGFPSALPSEFQHRSYDTTIAQTGSALEANLTGSQFRLNSLGRGNHFSGALIPGGVRFELQWYDSYYYPYYGPTSYPNIAEQVSGSRYLVTQGTANTSGSPGGSLTGSITNGGMVLWDSNFPTSRSRVLASCYAAINFTLNPR